MSRRLVFDIESDGLLDALTKVHCLVAQDVDTNEIFDFADQPGHAPITDGLKLLEEANTLIAHNGLRFDIPALKKVYPDFNPRARNLDTLVLSRLLSPEISDSDEKLVAKGLLPKKLRGRYSLEAFGHRLGLHKGDYSDDMKAHGLDPWASWNPEMHRYCLLDVEVNRAVWDYYERKWYDLDKPEAERVPYSDRAVDLEMRVAEILFRQEQRGVAFDVAGARKLYATLVGRRSELEDSLRDTFGSWNASAGVVTPKQDREVKRTDLDVTVTVRRFSDKTGNELKPYVGPIKEGYVAGAPYSKVKVVEFNPSSTQHIADRLQKLRGWRPTEFTPSGLPKVDDSVLSQLTWPEAKLVAEYLMVQKRIGQIAEGKQAWLKKEREGRIHGTVVTAGAVTRRMTHNNPNLAQVPSNGAPYGKDCRALFRPSEGFVMVGCDADALELRCLAGYMARFDDGAYIQTVLSGDKTAGTDMHSVNCRALGLDPKEKYTIDGRDMTGRDIAKIWFYAFIYGAGDHKLGTILGIRGADRKVRMRGKTSREDFLRNLPALGKLVDGVRGRVRQRGFLVGLDGGKLNVRSEHAALNTLLQSAGAIIMKWGLVILDDSLIASGLLLHRDYSFLLNIHDEWQLEVLPEHVETVKALAEEAIRKAGEVLAFGCPLAGNADHGPSWAATH